MILEKKIYMPLNETGTLKELRKSLPKTLIEHF